MNTDASEMVERLSCLADWLIGKPPRGATPAESDQWETDVRKALALIEQQQSLIGEMRAKLADFCAAAEYWAGCDEGCEAETASSEIMSSGGAWPAQAYDETRALLSKLGGSHD